MSFWKSIRKVILHMMIVSIAKSELGGKTLSIEHGFDIKVRFS